MRDESQVLRESHRFLSSFAAFPIDLLVTKRNKTRESGLVTPWLWSGEMPFGATEPIVDELRVTSPALTLLQLAARAGLVRTVLMASELCGTYSVYVPPAPIEAQLNRLAARGRLREFGQWRPCFSANGQVTSLWQRPALTTPQELAALAAEVAPRRGCKVLAQAAELCIPGAASPFETQAGILLGFSRRRGGEGFAGLTHNERVDLSREARLIADRAYCSCDLYWPEGLDVECQSAQYHDNQGSFLSDSDRSAALELMGVKVLPLTAKQLHDEDRFAAFSSAVAHALGVEPRPKTPAQVKAAAALREEVLTDWAALPFAV